jgi:hypothetical protein
MMTPKENPTMEALKKLRGGHNTLPLGESGSQARRGLRELFKQLPISQKWRLPFGKLFPIRSFIQSKKSIAQTLSGP